MTREILEEFTVPLFSLWKHLTENCHFSIKQVSQYNADIEVREERFFIMRECKQVERSGVTDVFWRGLKRREAAGDLIAVTIDEYKTSKVCNACINDPLVRMSELKGCSVLVCNTCKTLWQRDINACKNMLSISLSIWDGRDRPSKYRRN